MMAKGISIGTKDLMASLDQFSSNMQTHVVRSMAVAGGKVLRDEAKARAPVYDGSGDLKGGSTVKRKRVPGQLRDAIFLAYSDKQSKEGRATYSISWNKRKAPHGHLIEFGHWRYNAIINGYPTKHKLDQPKWVAAKPFLRPALDSKGDAALKAMVDRGREKVSEAISNRSMTDDSS
jgi:HK97 gp10 family phage protein